MNKASGGQQMLGWLLRTEVRSQEPERPRPRTKNSWECRFTVFDRATNQFRGTGTPAKVHCTPGGTRVSSHFFSATTMGAVLSESLNLLTRRLRLVR